jgi:hypothetical protein
VVLYTNYTGWRRNDFSVRAQVCTLSIAAALPIFATVPTTASIGRKHPLPGERV